VKTFNLNQPRERRVFMKKLRMRLNKIRGYKSYPLILFLSFLFLSFDLLQLINFF
jgi:hypothetical protein